MGLEAPLWRAVTVFRIATLAYAIVLRLTQGATYQNQPLGWAVIGVMTIWTFAAAILYSEPHRRRWPLLIADLLVTIACVIPTAWVVPAANLTHGASTLPMAWAAGPVLAWAISGGMRRGAAAALAVGATDLAIRGGINPVTVNATALLLLAGIVVGYVVRLGLDAEAQLRRATEMQAATRERDRLARGIHDSVLQVLSLIERRGSELGGEAAVLGRLAGQQGANLRSLVGVCGGQPAGRWTRTFGRRWGPWSGACPPHRTFRWPSPHRRYPCATMWRWRLRVRSAPHSTTLRSTVDRRRGHGCLWRMKESRCW